MSQPKKMSREECEALAEKIEDQVKVIDRRGLSFQKGLGPQQEEARSFALELRRSLEAEDLQVFINRLFVDLQKRHTELLDRLKSTTSRETVRRYVTVSRLEAVSQFARLLGE